jgi:hypothetical protein
VGHGSTPPLLSPGGEVLAVAAGTVLRPNARGPGIFPGQYRREEPIVHWFSRFFGSDAGALGCSYRQWHRDDGGADF